MIRRANEKSIEIYCRTKISGCCGKISSAQTHLSSLVARQINRQNFSVPVCRALPQYNRLSRPSWVRVSVYSIDDSSLRSGDNESVHSLDWLTQLKSDLQCTLLPVFCFPPFVFILLYNRFILSLNTRLFWSLSIITLGRQRTK